MGKSRRFGNDQSFKSHHDNNHKFNKKHNKSGWEPKRNYSDRDLNRRVRQGDFDDSDY